MQRVGSWDGAVKKTRKPPQRRADILEAGQTLNTKYVHQMLAGIAVGDRMCLGRWPLSRAQMECRSKWAVMGLGRRSPHRGLGYLPWTEGQTDRRCGGLSGHNLMPGQGGLGNLSASHGNSPGERWGLGQGDGGDDKILDL